MSSQMPLLAMRMHKPKPSRRIRVRLLLLAMAVGMLASACGATLPGRGSYPLDIFYEMHYQQSFKSNEPPVFSGVAGAVAWFPAPKSTAFETNTGSYLYGVNCSMCHGAQGKGDGPVLSKMIDTYGYQVKADPNLSGELVASFPDAVIETFMVSGIDVMPGFGKLLGPEERQAIIDYLRTLQQQ
ncbi:MAG: hypothetical protein BZY88_05855 [SAR202 cluster bacterium Io17-Chloro-G9]|nr:MAG: hypothetical protein BZY88_05855 [SAR202 cluster bacterium Io17-Chloro-G9]